MLATSLIAYAKDSFMRTWKQKTLEIMMCRGKRDAKLVIAASAGGGRCAADLAWSQLFEQENEDALSGTPRLLCFVLELDWYMSPGSESFQRTQSV
jgi:hypothetical protein